MQIFLKDNNGKPSATLTAFVLGFVIVCGKLLASGININDKIKLSDFSGVDFGAAVGALGAIYVLRKNSKDKKE